MLLLLALPGCSGNLGAHQVFVNTTESLHGPAHTDELVDVVVEFTNMTDKAVHLSSLSLSGRQPEIRYISARVYDMRHLGYFPAVGLGDLPKECPHLYIPAPVKSLAVAPHQYSRWFGVVTIRILKPGRYTIREIKVTYSTGGKQGWQYQSTNLTLTVRNPPLPGPRPVSSRVAC